MTTVKGLFVVSNGTGHPVIVYDAQITRSDITKHGEKTKSGLISEASIG